MYQGLVSRPDEDRGASVGRPKFAADPAWRRRIRVSVSYKKDAKVVKTA